METISSVSLDGLGFHSALVMIAAGLGYLLNSKVIGPNAIKGIPDFTIAYLLGLAFFLIFRHTPVYRYVDKNINSRISGTATDFLVFFGVAKINIQVIIEYAVPLIAVSAGVSVISLIASIASKCWYASSPAGRGGWQGSEE